MPRFKRTYDYDDSSSLNDGLNELFTLERSIERRLAIFLVLFAFVVVGALGSGSSSISSAGFSIGSIICWLIAISIILTTKKTGDVSKEIKKTDRSSFAQIERKLYSKIIRWILGYIIPVFCSIVLTFGSVASSAGWLDNVWFYKSKVESKIDQITNSLPEIKIEKQKPDDNPNFKPIDSMLNRPVNNQNSKLIQLNSNFKSIDSISTQKLKIESKQRTNTQTPNKYFKPIEKVEEK